MKEKALARPGGKILCSLRIKWKVFMLPRGIWIFMSPSHYRESTRHWAPFGCCSPRGGHRLPSGKHFMGQMCLVWSELFAPLCWNRMGCKPVVVQELHRHISVALCLGIASCSCARLLWTLLYTYMCIYVQKYIEWVFCEEVRMARRTQRSRFLSL